MNDIDIIKKLALVRAGKLGIRIKSLEGEAALLVLLKLLIDAAAERARPLYAGDDALLHEAFIERAKEWLLLEFEARRLPLSDLSEAGLAAAARLVLLDEVFTPVS